MWNGSKWIRRCLESVMADPYQNFKVLVIDNGSSDNSVEIVEENFPQVALIKNKKNYGFAEGNNIGIRCALKNNADYIALVNQDIIAHPFWLTRLVEAAEKHKEYGVLSPIVFDYEGEKIDPQFLRVLMNNEEFRNKDYIEDSFLDKVYEVLVIFGAALFIRKEVFLKVGLFDPLFFAYHEEGDFFQRALFHRIRTAVVTFSKVNHWHSLLHPEQINLKIKYLMFRNKFLVLLKEPRATLLKNLKVSFSFGIYNIKQKDNLIKKVKVVILTGYILFWLIIHMPLILLKRFKEKRGPAYL